MSCREPSLWRAVLYSNRLSLDVSPPQMPVPVIETHANCLNSADRFHYFLLHEPYFHNKAQQEFAIIILTINKTPYPNILCFSELT